MELGGEEFVDLGTANTTSLHVRAFYSCWLNFTTRKEFAWADKYNPTAAPDRKTRRLMEEENVKVQAAACLAFHSQTPHSPCPFFLSKRLSDVGRVKGLPAWVDGLRRNEPAAAGVNHTRAPVFIPAKGRPLVWLVHIMAQSKGREFR